eukprot:m.408966 g.408966  ORF g.408966 m.408966 type:complete len:92 (+) comp21238_c0_seq31:85-360(+)
MVSIVGSAQLARNASTAQPPGMSPKTTLGPKSSVTISGIFALMCSSDEYICNEKDTPPVHAATSRGIDALHIESAPKFSLYGGIMRDIDLF